MSNLPLNLGLAEKEIGEIVTRFLIENYLNDEGNFQPVKEVIVDHAKNSAIIELSSVEEANRLAKIESVKVLGHSCRISRVGETQFGQTTNLATLVQNAQTSAQAQAAALAAMNLLQKKDTSFVLSKPNILGNASKILKISNLVNPDDPESTSPSELREILEDMRDQFKNYGKIVSSFIVGKEKTAPGAETGTVFIEYESSDQSEKALNALSDKAYMGRELRIIYVDEEQYKKSFAPLKN